MAESAQIVKPRACIGAAAHHSPAIYLSGRSISNGERGEEALGQFDSDDQKAAIESARAELVQRIGLIDARTRRTPDSDLATDIAMIRRIAHRHGLYPAASVARTVESALMHGERGPLISGWLSILRDAVVCDRQDAQACDTFTAACSVRLTG